MSTKTYFHYGWRLELDPAEIVPDDPGAGTPAMVYGPNGESGTFHAVLENAEISLGDDYSEVPEDVLIWLSLRADDVESFLNAPR